MLQPLPPSLVDYSRINHSGLCMLETETQSRDAECVRTPRAVECWRLQSLRGRRRRESLETVTVLFLDNNSPKYNVPNPFEGGDERYAPSWYRTVVGLVVGPT